jgi:hypothetical protein
MINKSKCDEQVLLFQPKNKPYEMLEKISAVFKLNPAIQSAYFACIQYPNPYALSRFLIAVEVVQDLELILQKLKPIFNKLKIDAEKIVLVNASNSSFKHYFEKIIPFYSKEIIKCNNF